MNSTVPRGKILIEVDYRFVYDAERCSQGVVVITHPALNGELSFNASSVELAVVQAQHLDKSPKVNQDPVSVLMNGATNLAESIAELKDVMGK